MKLAVLGHPISHSRSPAIQNAALAAAGLAPEWEFSAIDVAPQDFEALVRGLPTGGYRGVNVTVPHKLAALRLANAPSDAARAIGAANVLTFDGERISAANTDTNGLIDALPSDPSGARALVLGAGGAGRASVWALKQAGAEVTIWNRTQARGEALATEFGVDWVIEPGDFDLLVNCTTVGMAEASGGQHPDGQRVSPLKRLPIDADALRANQVVVDLVYGSVETQLIAAARERGATTVDGIEVLVRQGVASFRIWTGMDVAVEVMRDAARGQ